MIAQNNATHIVVGKDISLATSGARSALSTGQIGIFKNGGGTASNTALVAGDVFVASIKDADGNVLSTPHVKYNDILSKSATTYSAPTQKKVYVGYNGTSGSITAANSSLYIIRAILKDSTAALQEHPLYEYADYNSDASATQEEVALGLIKTMVNNFTNFKKKSKVTVVQPGLINSATVVLTNDFAGTLTLVAGSKYATATSSGQYATSTDIVVGDYVRLGATSSTAVSLTGNVYKIVSISGTTTKTIEFDRPVVENGAYATGTGTEVVPAATAAAANFGISLTGLALPFKPGMIAYAVIDFEVLLNDAFGTTAVTVATSASEGSGTYQQVAELEWFLKKNRGEVYRVADYPVDNVLAATSGKTYAIVTVNYKVADTKLLDRNVAQTATLMFATESDSSGAPHANLKTVFGIS